ncbi:MAG: cell division protein SepF [Candidatus Pacearchaeota archaeon]
MVFDKIKKGLSNAFGGEEEPEYIEIDLGREVKKSKVIVRPFILKSFEDVTPILNALREGYTIAIIDIKILKSKDVIELKRAISKIKKTADALEGSIAGFGESVIIVTPQFADIYKSSPAAHSIDRMDERDRRRE